MLSSCCNMRKEALHHTDPKHSLAPTLLDFLPHSHGCSNLSVCNYSKSWFGCSCPTSKLFCLDQPIVAFTVSAAEGLSGWQGAKKWQPHLEDHSHSPTAKHYLCGEDSSCVITRVGISNECCVCDRSWLRLGSQTKALQEARGRGNILQRHILSCCWRVSWGDQPWGGYKTPRLLIFQIYRVTLKGLRAAMKEIQAWHLGGAASFPRKAQWRAGEGKKNIFIFSVTTHHCH